MTCCEVGKKSAKRNGMLSISKVQEGEEETSQS